MFKFYTDAGHGWVAVKIQMLHDLGIADKITSYSYMRGHTAYLEEDRDAVTFRNAYRARFGYDPSIVHKSHVNRSPIRSYNYYVPT